MKYEAHGDHLRKAFESEEDSEEYLRVLRQLVAQRHLAFARPRVVHDSEKERVDDDEEQDDAVEPDVLDLIDKEQAELVIEVEVAEGLLAVFHTQLFPSLLLLL